VLAEAGWGVRRFFVRVPGGGVINVAQEHPADEAGHDQACQG
jgi:hypothetical protein